MSRIEQLEKIIAKKVLRLNSRYISKQEKENIEYELIDLYSELAEKKEYDNLESMGIEY